jgi:hypothetical protein
MARPISRIFVLTTAAAAASAFAPAALAAVLAVPSSFPTIQAAIDAAVDGDVVAIAPGIYSEAVTVDGKSIALVGGPGVVLDASGADRSVLTITNAADVFVSGLVLARGTGTSLDTECYPFGAFTYGGGALVRASSVLFEDCRFEDNTAQLGGGLWYEAGSTVDVLGGAFVGNSGEQVGAALGGCFVGVENSLVVDGTEFAENVDAGVIFVFGALVPARGVAVVRNATFTGNTGLATVMTPGANPIDLRVEHSTFRGNDRPFASVFMGGVTPGSSVVVEDCLIEDEFSSIGGGPAVLFASFEGDSTFEVRDTIVRRSPGIAVSAVLLGDGTASIERCTFEETGGGVLLLLDESKADVDRLEVRSPTNTGFYSVLNDGVLDVSNLLVANGLREGVVVIGDSPLQPTNSARFGSTTVVQNALGGLDFTRAELGSFNVVNSIIAENGLFDVSFGPTAAPAIAFSLVPGGVEGPGNIADQPFFVDASLGDFRLAPESPAIDAGNSLLLQVNETLDLAGAPRRIDVPGVVDTGFGGAPVVDMGAFETTVDGASPSPDLDGDGMIGAGDLALLLGAWGPCAACIGCAADLDGDCAVGAGDLAILLGAWGR